MSKNNSLIDSLDRFTRGVDSLNEEMERVEGLETAIIETFREWRKGKGLSLRECAKRMEISAAYLSDVENGRRGVTSKLVEKMRVLISLNK